MPSSALPPGCVNLPAGFLPWAALPFGEPAADLHARWTGYESVEDLPLPVPLAVGLWPFALNLAPFYSPATTARSGQGCRKHC